MANEELLRPGGPVLKQAAHFKLGTDTVLLADFARTASTSAAPRALRCCSCSQRSKRSI